ncbi:amidase family protein [Streptomyces arenae]|uniref:amidase family protein n=1 Tax=Streptomyces arenae TaxID=29301 RepID=UPI00265826CD|nr:amidase family protein [Streptomyces arenae]MCG7203688.1 hypothetical protein [Streptomyces arenae]
MSKSTAPLGARTAADLTAAVRSREVSAEDVGRSFPDRVEQTSPHLNALVEVRPDEALEQARQAGRAVAADDPLGPLHGVPVSVKINTDQRGHVSTHGVDVFKAAPPASEGAACVAALRDAGAILLGRGNAPAFLLRRFTANAAHGSTLNPWDAGRTPGGSSGGAARRAHPAVGRPAHERPAHRRPVRRERHFGGGRDDRSPHRALRPGAGPVVAAVRPREPARGRTVSQAPTTDGGGVRSTQWVACS